MHTFKKNFLLDKTPVIVLICKCQTHQQPNRKAGEEEEVKIN
jgi:hypothetical protein